MTGELLPFRFPVVASGVTSAEAREAATAFLAAGSENRSNGLSEFHLDNPETMLALCQLLDSTIESSPAEVLEAARCAYDSLEGIPGGTAGFLFDEREYYLGELALIAGCSCRFLTLRDEARLWLDRASAWFLLTANTGGDVARVAYQRLALKLEERQFSEVLRSIPPLLESFRRGNANELALKCRYLEGVALKETGRLDEAVSLFEEISAQAKALNSARILGSTYVILIQLHSELNHAAETLTLVQEATPFLRSTNNRVALAKLQWGVGMLMRTQSRPAEAIEAFRASQLEFQEIEMRADVAALHLIIADLLLETGQDRQAEWEIRAALPVIEQLKMVPEGFAAMSLLRESLRRRVIDRGALRKLHGYFEEISS